MKPVVGSIVHACIEGPRDEPIWRPAIVTAVSGDLVNITVWLDAKDDMQYDAPLGKGFSRIDTIHARGVGRPEGEVPGCWRWPPSE